MGHCRVCSRLVSEKEVKEIALAQCSVLLLVNYQHV
jgi:hypothetical protein